MSFTTHRTGWLSLLSAAALLALTPPDVTAAHPGFRGGLPHGPALHPFMAAPHATMPTRFTTPFAFPPAPRVLSTSVVPNRFLRQATTSPLTRFQRNAAFVQGGLAAVGGFPFGAAFASPFNAALLARSADLAALNSVWNNPYAYGLPAYAAYAGLYGGYGSGGYGSGGYGGGYGGYGSVGSDSGQWVADYLAQVKAADQAAKAPTLFTAFGLPSRDGRLQWPLGVRLLPSTGEAARLRDQVDLLTEAAFGQKAQNGSADASLVRKTSRAIGDLRHQLAGRSSAMPLATYEDAQSFLRRLQDTVEGLR